MAIVARADESLGGVLREYRKTIRGGRVVMEPTDIVMVDEERFRMVDRIGGVGEKILIVNGGLYVSAGQIGVVEIVRSNMVLADIPENRNVYGDEVWYVDHNGYKVLEPVESAKSGGSGDITALSDNIAKNIASLERRISQLERQLDKLKPAAKEVKRMTRADVIQCARDDFAQMYSWSMYDFRFRTNRKHRTVVCDLWLGGKKIRSGRAKCAEDDVFNIHIGRIIALHRALATRVPDYYMNAPQPTEPKVGDVVHITGINGTLDYIDVLLRRKPEKDGTGYGKLAFSALSGRGWIADKQFRIIDDSRTGTEAEDYGI